MYNVLIIGGKDSSVCWPGVENYHITFFQSKDSITPAQLQRADRLCIVDFEDEAAVIDLAKHIHQSKPFNAVVSFSERTLLVASLIGEQLDIIHNPVDSVRKSQDKGMFRSAMRGTPYELPARSVTTMEDLESFLHDHRKVILKPTFGSGSRGVYEVQRGMELSQLVLDGPYVAELYAEGIEYSIESLSLDGRHTILGITQKYTTGSPNYVETGHDFPAQLSSEVNRQIVSAVEDLLRIIGHRWGPAHTEVKVDDERLQFIETQTRFGGDQIWEMVWMVTGVHLAKATIDGMLGCGGDRSPTLYREMAIRFLDVNRPTFNFARLSSHLKGSSVVRVQLENGRFDRQLGCSSDRHGYALFGRSDTTSLEEFKNAVSGLEAL